ncbi:MAG: hypothetical protein IH940_12565 [Acidobacteria bacterium]|nr:hypothetical protein [Acidobacteriota bacterium]
MSWPDLLLDKLGRDRGSSTLIARHQLPDSAYDLFHGPDGVGVCAPDLGAQPPVVVSRTAEVDMSDMLGRAAGVDCFQQSSFVAESERGDAFLLNSDFSPTEVGSNGLGIEIELQLDCPDSPFGALSAFYLFDGESKLDPITGPSAEHVDKVKVTAPYLRILEWLHFERVLLGHLIMEGYGVNAEIYTFGYLEGWISASSTAPRSALEKLTSYTAVRRSKQLIALLDQLDDVVDT